MNTSKPSSGPRQRELFLKALEKPTAAERSAFLEGACGNDSELRAAVEFLLANHQEDSFLERPPTPAPGAATIQGASPKFDAEGTQIDRYKLLEKLGEGGFGVVYMAEQREPVKRRVALKIIKVGMDTREVVARFEAERQALALMDHSNIARVLDAGATNTGRPYFVMELVRGIKITDYCDQNHVGLEERLKLFMQVCNAVQHAHQKGVIHRDLKPSNILVTLHDGVPVPKVIDFGIAKATQQELTEKTLFTQLHQFIGTPSYMSPEQAELSGLDIDTRSDIYSLGVLLYELLTGTTPFDAKELLNAGLDGMRRIIRETEPMRPSTRLTALQARRGEGRPGDAEASAGGSRALGSRLKPVSTDLDWIVMKCLEKDRNRRYETANGLAADIRRQLGNEPVVARPPSAAYRLQKLVRRNKLAFAAAAGIAFVLLVGVVVSTWQAIRATRAELEQVKLRQQAQSESAKREQVARFLGIVAVGGNPSEVPGVDVPALRQVLDKTAERLEGEVDIHPAGLFNLGLAYATLGEFGKAEALARRALALGRKLEIDTADILRQLLSVLAAQKKYHEAATVLAEELTVVRNDSLRSAELLRTRGEFSAKQTKWIEAATDFKRAIELDPDNHYAYHVLAPVLVQLDDSAGYREHVRQIVIRFAGTTNPIIAERMAKACSVKPQAELEWNAVAELANTAVRLGRDSPLLPWFQLSRGMVELRRGRYEASTQALREALRAPDFNRDVTGQSALAMALWNLRQTNAALETLAKAIGVAAKLPRMDEMNWNDWIIGQSFLREARETMKELLKLEAPSNLPVRAQLIRLDAEMNARRGSWKDAAAGFARAADMNPSDQELRHALISSLVQGGDVAGYYEESRRTLENFGRTTDPNVAERTAKDCSILPPKREDLPAIVRLANLAVESGRSHDDLAWFHLARGLAEYRAGHLKASIDSLGPALGPANLQRELEAHAILAMAHHKLKHTAEAHVVLGRALEISAKLPPLNTDDLGSEWKDHVIGHILLKEARTLIEGHAEGVAGER